MSSNQFSATEVVAMENAAAAAWPATRIDIVDGWRVRRSGGGARRGNSVLPFPYEGEKIDASIDACEQLYREQQSRAYFQVSSASEPDGLDAVLDARGYRLEEPCLLLAKRMSVAQSTANIDVEQSPEPTADWQSIYFEQLDPTRRATASDVLANVPYPRVFLLHRLSGQPCTTALGVVVDKTAVVECVATAQGMRRNGAAQRIMQAVETWATMQRAGLIALQVVADNRAARQLYETRGYSIAGRYHYRWKDV